MDGVEALQRVVKGEGGVTSTADCSSCGLAVTSHAQFPSYDAWGWGPLFVMAHDEEHKAWLARGGSLSRAASSHAAGAAEQHPQYPGGEAPLSFDEWGVYYLHTKTGLSRNLNVTLWRGALAAAFWFAFSFSLRTSPLFGLTRMRELSFVCTARKGAGWF